MSCSCSSCGSPTTYNCNSCSSCPTPPVCGGCTYTLNTDCIIFNKDKLCYEPDNTTNNSSRTLTTVLQNACNLANGAVESVFYEDDFTLDSTYNNKVIILEDSGDVEDLIVTLPVNSLDYAGKIYTFINKSTAAGATWKFSLDIQYDYDPLSTSDEFNTLQTSSHRVLKLAFIKTNPTSYAWTILN